MKLLLPLLALMICCSLSPITNAQASAELQKAATNKQIVKTVFEEVINKKNLAILDKYYSKDVIDHSAFPDQLPGLEGLKNSVNYLFDNYPGIHVTIEEIIAEGDFVVTRDSWTATEKSSGKKRSGWVIHIVKLKSGVVTEEWSKGWEWLTADQ